MFIIRVYHDALSSERLNLQNGTDFLCSAVYLTVQINATLLQLFLQFVQAPGFT